MRAVLTGILALAATAALALPASSQSVTTEAWIAPTGTDTAPCTRTEPCATLTRAAQTLPAGGDIRLTPGRYGWQRDITAKPTGRLTVHAAGSTVNGLECKGCQNLTVLDGRWASITIQDAADITLDGLNVTSSGGANVRIVCSRRVRVYDSELQGGSHGVQGPGNTCQSQDITVDGNRISGQTVDGVAFGSWDDVTVTHNQIFDIKDPRGIDHNDGIQLYGRNTSVTVASNRILRARSQGIIVKADTGPIDDVTLAHNVVEDTFSVPVYIQNATNVRAVSNVVCGGPESDGALWFTDSTGIAAGNVLGSTGQSAQALKAGDAVTAGNVLVDGGC